MRANEPAASELQQFREEIERIIASPEFASSRQLQDFLRYTSEKSLLGVTHLEQTEIAFAVLGRGPDFNPVEDASVRKMATNVRQRLEQYYSRQQHSSDVVVVLPVRSYVPQLKRTGHAQSQVVELPPAPSRFRLRWVVPLALFVVVAAAFAFRLYPGSGAASVSPIVLTTVTGDVIQGSTLAPGPGVQLGPPMHEVDEVTVRLDFSPNMEAQQAGLVVWQDVHHFIRLGRKFFGRNQIEFLLQEANHAVTIPANTVYDGDGQSGQPLWLSIHRDGNQYRAYLSRDGVRWEPHGEPIIPATPLIAPRAGIYALNGRREAPSIRAAFSHLSTGVTFGSAAAASLEAYARSGWSTLSTCPEKITQSMEAMSLRVAFASNPGNCDFEIYRPLTGREWDLTTRVDVLPHPGRSVGLRILGSKASIRLGRYSLNGPAIAYIHDGKTLIGRPDLNGSPTIYLRLRASGGVLTAGYSTDGEKFDPLPVRATVDELGDNVRGGIRFSTSPTDQEEPSSSARFYWLRESIESLSPYR